MRYQDKIFWALFGVLIGLGLANVGHRLLAQANADQSSQCVTIPLDTVRAELAKIVRRELTEDAKSIPNRQFETASRSSAEFVAKHMPKTPSFRDRFALLEHSLKEVKADGLYLELGVYKGSTINSIADQVDHTIHGFDSFEGLPETWRTGFPKGTFATVKLPKVRDNVELHAGWFDKSLPKWAAAHPGPIAFMHLDADLYSSTKTVFDILGDRIVVGTVLQFDEFFNYPGWRNGEFKAFQEFVERRDLEYEYLGYTDGHIGEQVAVRVTAIGKD